MNHKLLMMLISAMIVVGTDIAHATECKGVNFPDHAQVDGATLTLNGLGLRQATMLKVSVYVAALYTIKPSADPNAILASNAPSELILQFVRDVGAEDLRKGWEEGFEKTAKGQLLALKAGIETLKGWTEDIKTGQRLTFVLKPGVGTQLDLNGTVKGTIKGDDFAKALLSIWLIDPPNPEIKSGLLGGACG